MTAEEIRKWASKAHKDIGELGKDAWPSEIVSVLAQRAADTQMGQLLMLAEIAAQLAEANKLTRFEMGLEDTEPET